MADTIELTTDSVRAVEQWQRNRHYKVELLLRQVTPTEDGSASYEVVDAKGAKASPSDIREAENETFKETAQRTRNQEKEGEEMTVLTPASGAAPTPSDSQGPR